MRTIITQENEINKFISENCEKRFDFLPSVPRKHIRSMLLSFTERGNSGKTADFAEYSHTHRTSSGHFLSKGKWDEHRLDHTQKREIFSTVEAQALENGRPIYVSIDDTVCEKTKPSSGAKHPMEKAGWHFSHTAGKQVYGYQFLGIHLGTGDAGLCYDLERYEKESRTKVQMSRDILCSLPETEANVIVMMDCWYTSADFVHLCEERNFTLIGAVKTNRILYPDTSKKKMSAADYAASLTEDPFHPVTMNGQTYLVYRYEGRLNKIRKAVVLLSYPANRFGRKEALRGYLCSDTTLTDEEILEHYSHRWKIEVLFRNYKRRFGIKTFMVRTALAIDRLLIIAVFAGFVFHALHWLICSR